MKFTYRYNEDAHNTVANTEVDGESLAPKLYGCYPVPGCRNLKMVLMDKVDGERMGGRTGLRHTFFDSLKKALDALHEKNYVFGDLRRPNILVVKQGDRLLPKLVDFDWAAVHGQGLYPEDLSRSANRPDGWPAGVYPLAPMNKNHDIVLFDALKKRFQV